MSKRQATNELTQDNWNEDDDQEEPGLFSIGTREDLENRPIKQAKRTSSSNTYDNSSNEQKPSPFSRLKGFSTFHSKEPDFKSILLPSTVTNGKQNGAAAVNQGFKMVSEGVSDNTSSKQQHNSEYCKKLQLLNENFIEWIQMHVKKNPFCNFTPVFRDYETYFQDLEKEYLLQNDNKMESTSSATLHNPNTFSGFKNNSAVQSSSLSEDSNVKSVPSYASDFSFGAKDMFKGSSQKIGQISNVGTTSTSSFGIPDSNSNNSTIINPFFGGVPSTEFVGSFSSGKDAPFTFAASSNVNADDKKEEEYEPPKNIIMQVAEPDALYSKRCKLFYKKEDTYVDKGVGVLYLKALEGKTQLLIRADTNMGNILLNIHLNESLPTKRMGKNNVVIVCIPNPPLHPTKPEQKEAIPLLIRVKTAEEADELLKQLDKHKS